MLELQLLVAASGQLHAQGVRVDELGAALEILHLPVLDELPRAARQPLDDRVLEVAQLREIDVGLTELDAPRLRVTRLVETLRDVQQRLRWNAATVHTDAARIHLRIDERGTETEIRGKKRGRVPPRSATDDDDLGGRHGVSDRSSRRHEAHD